MTIAHSPSEIILKDRAPNARRTLAARRLVGSEVLTSYQSFTRSIFNANVRSHDYVPVYIPAKNEEDDLPATLLSIATQHGSAFPIVIDNNSNDSTIKVATQMGAEVISVPYGKKTAATKASFEHASEEKSDQPFLFTDADTSCLPTWSYSLSSAVQEADRGNGSAVFGNSLLWYGDSFVADAILSAAKMARALRNNVNGRVTARGHNYGIKLDPEGYMLEAMRRLDDNMFVNDDSTIKSTLQKSGANVVAANGIKSLVVTKNDRGSFVVGRLNGKEYRAKRKASYEAS